MNKNHIGTFACAGTKQLVLITGTEGDSLLGVVIRQNNFLQEKKYKPRELRTPPLSTEKILKAIQKEITPPEYDEKLFENITKNDPKKKEAYDTLRSAYATGEVPLYESTKEQAKPVRNKKAETTTRRAPAPIS